MPKFAIISDIHGNFNALKSVIEVLEIKKPDQWICLGDIVGYGPNPVECLEIVIEMGMSTVLGNHDAGVVGRTNLNFFKNPNRRLLEKTKEMLSSSHINWINNLPYLLRGESWIAAHSSPIQPEEWRYLESAIHIRSILNKIPETFCFIGHTHKPSLVPEKLGIRKIAKGCRYLINPGSVGQSRDDDYRASCAFLNTDNYEYENIRVDYDLEPILTNFSKIGFTREEARQLMKFL